MIAQFSALRCWLAVAAPVALWKLRTICSAAVTAQFGVPTMEVLNAAKSNSILLTALSHIVEFAVPTDDISIIQIFPVDEGTVVQFSTIGWAAQVEMARLATVKSRLMMCIF